MKMKKIVSLLLCAMLIYGFSSTAFSHKSGKLYSMNGNAYSTKIYNENRKAAVLKSSGIKLAKGSEAALPEKYDSRTKNILTPVKDQGNSGLCWAFATMSALETDAIVQGYKTVDNADFSETHLAWFTYADNPSSGEHYISDTPYDIGGSWARSAGTLSAWSGIAEDGKFPFDKSDYVGKTIPESNRYDRSSGLIIRDVQVFGVVREAKEWIMNHGSCTASILWGKNYENTETSAYYFNTSTNYINHMITIVGWDDNYPAENFLTPPEDDGAWIVKDSFGTQHHDNGYYMLSYYDESLCDFAGFSVQPADRYVKNYTYNSVGYDAYGEHDNGAKAANVYTAQGYEELRAVSLYTVNENTTVQISVYGDVDMSGNNPENGVLKSQKTVSFPIQGYYTVDLDSAVELRTGTKFSVVLTYSCDKESEEGEDGEDIKGTVYVPTEYMNLTENGCKFTCRKGQSYCLFSDECNTWCDSTDLEYGNFYIQAFTVPITGSVVIADFDRTPLEYKSEMTFFAVTKGCASSQWHTTAPEYTVNGDGSLTVKNLKDDFEVYCTAVSYGGETVTSEKVTVKVKHGFFDRLLATFRSFFRMIAGLFGGK